MLTRDNRVNYISKETKIGARNLNNIQDSILDNNEKIEDLNREVNSIGSQLAHKANKGDSISVTQIDKNLGKLDQTYMTDEFLQQMAGNTPINAVPVDDGVTLRKLDSEIRNVLNMVKKWEVKLYPGLFENGSCSTSTIWKNVAPDRVNTIMLSIPIDITSVNINDVIHIRWNNRIYQCSAMLMDDNYNIINSTRTDWQKKLIDIVRCQGATKIGILFMKHNSSAVTPQAISEDILCDIFTVENDINDVIESNSKEINSLSDLAYKGYADILKGVEWVNVGQGAGKGWYYKDYSYYNVARLSTAITVPVKNNVMCITWNNDEYDMSYKIVDENNVQIFNSGWTLYESPYYIPIPQEGAFIGFSAKNKKDTDTTLPIQVSELSSLDPHLYAFTESYFHNLNNTVMKELSIPTIVQGGVNASGSWGGGHSDKSRIKTISTMSIEPNKSYVIEWDNSTDYEVSYRTFVNGKDAYTSGWTLHNSPYTITPNANLIGFSFRKKDDSEISPGEFSNIGFKFKTECYKVDLKQDKYIKQTEIDTGVWENKSQGATGSWYNSAYQSNRLRTQELISKKPNTEYILTWNNDIYDASYRTFIDGEDCYTSSWTLKNSPWYISDEGNQIGFVFRKKGDLDLTVDDLEEMDINFAFNTDLEQTIDIMTDDINKLAIKVEQFEASGATPNIVSTLNFEGTDTQKIQKALDYLESKGGGILQLEARTYELSMSSSKHTKACIIVPKNVHIRGCGIDATIIKRVPSERGINGILLINKNFDTKGNFEADGNIMYSDFTITDGAVSPQRGWGDLIAVTHSHDTVIERVKSLNHDQHFVDISGSYNTIIRDCISHNDVNAAASAIYQIDFGGGVWGTSQSDFKGNEEGRANASKKVLIENCIITGSYATNVIHYHNAISCEDVVINNCFVEMTGTTAHNIIGTDTTSVPNSLTISNNRFYINNPNAKVVNIVSPNCKDIFIENNIIKGTAKGININSSGGSNICIEHNKINTDNMAITVANTNDVSLIYNKINNKNNKYNLSGVKTVKSIDEDVL